MVVTVGCVSGTEWNVTHHQRILAADGLTILFEDIAGSGWYNRWDNRLAADGLTILFKDIVGSG